MERQELAEYLRRQIEASDAEGTETVQIRKQAAAELLRLLSGEQAAPLFPVGRDGETLFYCADCSRSFWAKAREDEECFRRWQYHTWYAQCPACGREVSRNDRYWR